MAGVSGAAETLEATSGADVPSSVDARSSTDASSSVDARSPTAGLVDITAAPRAVIATAADLLFLVGRSVLGPDRIPTARANAWAAVRADQERAQLRADVQRIVSR